MTTPLTFNSNVNGLLPIISGLEDVEDARKSLATHNYFLLASKFSDAAFDELSSLADAHLFKTRDSFGLCTRPAVIGDPFAVDSEHSIAIDIETPKRSTFSFNESFFQKEFQNGADKAFQARLHELWKVRIPAAHNALQRGSFL